MRAALGDGYVQALRGAWPEVPESADFVMHWWSRAAALVAARSVRRSGLITTNSLRQTFNRRVVQVAYDKGIGLIFAIPDHPWVDSANGAAVRIAMTVAMPTDDAPAWGPNDDAPFWGNDDDPAWSVKGRLLTVLSEQTGEFGEVTVTLAERWGNIHSDLSIGANVGSALALKANANISSPGVKLHGAGFIVTNEEAVALGLGFVPGLEQYIRDYRNGRDLTNTPRAAKVIDLLGLTAEQLREKFPSVYQRLLERVKPERDQNNRATYRDNWWLFGEPRRELRPALAGLPRYIATVETAKHRTFQFLDAGILPDNMLIAIASNDAFHLGVLSSRAHIVWALAVGGRLGVGNDPRYNKSRCFETFPFPDDDTGLTPGLREHIAALAEQIDAHRKRQQVENPGLTLTGMYNVLDALREGRALTAKEKIIHSQGLVAVLKDLHDELDTAALHAYGLEADLDTDTLLTHLTALNVRRAAEEKVGLIRWLRPGFQNRSASQMLQNQDDLATVRQGVQAEMVLKNRIKPAPGKPSALSTQPWPASLPEQVRALAQVLASHSGALTVAEIETRFKGRGPWKKGLPRILETLEALGRARRDKNVSEEYWRA